MLNKTIAVLVFSAVTFSTSAGAAPEAACYYIQEVAASALELAKMQVPIERVLQAPSKDCSKRCTNMVNEVTYMVYSNKQLSVDAIKRKAYYMCKIEQLK